MHTFHKPCPAVLASAHKDGKDQDILVWDILPDPCNPTKMAISTPTDGGWTVLVSADRVRF